MNTLIHYLEIYRVQLKNNFVREAVYRTNFLTTLFVDFIWIVVEFSLFTVIYANTTTLGGWTQPQIFFFLGVFFSSDALFTVFFQRNFWVFSDLVNKGELDILLTKPTSPVFLALTRSINITAIFNVVLGVLIMIKYAGPAGFAGGLAWFKVPVWLTVGLFTALHIRFFSSVWVFWTDRSWAFTHLYYQFFNFASKPDTIYPKAIRFLLRTALPFAFIGSVPARALLDGLSTTEELGVAAVLCAFFAANGILWNLGLRRYQSASS